MSTDTIYLTSGTATVVIDSSQGGRIASWTVDGIELMSGMDRSDVGWGSYPMVPWQGRLTDNSVTWRGQIHLMPATYAHLALHGRTYFRPWSVDDASASHAILSTELGTDEDDPWPWPCKVVSEYQLSDDRLDMRLEATPFEGECPVELGWHPWFTRQLPDGAHLEVDLGPGRMYLRDDSDMLTGDLVDPSGGPYDDAFELPGREVVLRWGESLELRCTTDCDYVVYFTALDHVVALEPQTAPPDWINRAPGVATVDAPRNATASWRWRRLSAPATTA